MESVVLFDKASLPFHCSHISITIYMMGAEIFHSALSHEATLRRHVGLIEELRHSRDGANGGDSRLQAFAGAVLLEHEENPSFRQVVDDYVEQRPDIEQPSMAENLLLRVFQKQLLRRELIDGTRYPYPGPYDAIPVWRRNLADFTAPDSFVRPEIIDDLAHRHSKANIMDRYKAFLLLLALGRGRFDTPANVLDVGCSQNHGLKRMALSPDVRLTLDFSKTTVVSSPSPTRNARQSQLVDTLLQYTKGVGDSVGVDIDDMYDPSIQEWAKACSFYPSELLDIQEVANYEVLDSIEALPDAKIGFKQADFANIDIDQFVEGSPRQYDMIIFSAMLHQASPEHRQTMLANARRLVKPNGLIVVQDFVRIDPANAANLQFFRHWFARPYRFRTVYTSRESDFREFSEAMRWYNARCKIVKLSPGLGRLPLAARYGLAAL